MAARKPGRYLAPIALLGVVAAIFMLVRANESTTSHASPPVIPRTLAHSPPGAAHSPAARHRIFYTVQAGDTLSGISGRTGIPVATLLSLNPNLNPNALQTGQRLRLRR